MMQDNKTSSLSQFLEPINFKIAESQTVYIVGLL